MQWVSTTLTSSIVLTASCAACNSTCVAALRVSTFLKRLIVWWPADGLQDMKPEENRKKHVTAAQPMLQASKVLQLGETHGSKLNQEQPQALKEHLIDPLILELSRANHQVMARCQTPWMFAVPAPHVAVAFWADSTTPCIFTIRFTAGGMLPTQPPLSTRVADQTILHVSVHRYWQGRVRGWQGLAASVGAAWVGGRARRTWPGDHQGMHLGSFAKAHLIPQDAPWQWGRGWWGMLRHLSCRAMCVKPDIHLTT